MALLFLSRVDNPAKWSAALRRQSPDLDIRVWPDTGPADEIDAALVWNHPPGELRRFPKLRLILSLGAGVNHILDDPDLPPGVPIARLELRQDDRGRGIPRRRDRRGEQEDDHAHLPPEPPAGQAGPSSSIGPSDTQPSRSRTTR